MITGTLSTGYFEQDEALTHFQPARDFLDIGLEEEESQNDLWGYLNSKISVTIPASSGELRQFIIIELSNNYRKVPKRISMSNS